MKSSNKKSQKNPERPVHGRPNEIPEKQESENESIQQEERQNNLSVI